MAKKLSVDTVKNMKNNAIMKAGMWLLGCLFLIAIGVSFATKEGAGGGAIGFGLLIAVGGGGFSGYTSYNIITDSKNQKTCNNDYWASYDCVANPTKDGDYDLDVTLCEAQTKAEYEGLFSRKYAGVWLTSNSSNSANFDAFYIPGDTESVELKTDNSAKKGKVYVRKAKANGDDDKGVSVKGTISGCGAAPPPSSPSSPSSPP